MQNVFTCKRCGHCCHGSGGIILMRKDVARLAAHFSMEAPAFLAAYAEEKAGRERLRCSDDGYCIFYDHGLKGCGAHEARPDVCRAWPFFAGNLLDETSFDMVSADCRGILREAGHEAFRDAGLAYVREHALGRGREDGEDLPGALRFAMVTGGATGNSATDGDDGNGA